MGDGFGIMPSAHNKEDVAISSFTGEITTIFLTNHALAITGEDGLRLIVHVGIDTVSLNGEGFKTLVAKGQKVKIGEPLLTVDFIFLKEQEKDPTVIVACSNLVNQEVDLRGDCPEVDYEQEGVIALVSTV